MNETDLRWRLRQLPGEIEPARDLWPGIAVGIGLRHRRHAISAGLAIAASALIAVALAWQSHPLPSAEGGTDLGARVVRTQAQAITEEYQAAFRQLQVPPSSAEYSLALQTIDRDLGEIQRAIAAEPQSLLLLRQLRKTYSRRLELTKRAATG